MSKLFISAIILILSIIAFTSGYLLFGYKGSFAQEVVTVEETSEESAFENKLEPIYSRPVRLVIPEINVETYIEKVGVEEDGTLGLPSDWNTVGWYKKSSKAGESGNVVLDGHYDDNYGRPAIFWGLKNLKTDDKVMLVDTFGRTYSYQITETFYLDISDSERLEVLESNDSRNDLTLITCGGVWLPAEQTYNKRLVVKAELSV